MFDLVSMKLASGKAIGLISFTTILTELEKQQQRQQKVPYEEISVCDTIGYSWQFMDYRVASGIFMVLKKSYIMVFRWSRYSLFSVVLCFFFITVYPHVCMCTEMFQSATLTQCGWHSFLYYA